MSVPITKTLGFLPNMCVPQSVLRVVIIAELIAIIIALAGSSDFSTFFMDLGMTSLFIIWVSLVSIFMICLVGKYQRKPSTMKTTLIVLSITIILTLVASLLAVMALSYQTTGIVNYWNAHLFLKNIFISVVFTLLFLRYFYVQHQWEVHVHADTSAKYDALQSRMRPHFLFNSLNTIAQLVHMDADKAEDALLDLAAFMRTILDKRNRISLREELDLTVSYLNMEALRLGKNRLSIVWDMDQSTLPMDMDIPPLLLQPLVENAIYHGIQPRQDGGTLGISLFDQGDSLGVSVTNPIPPDDANAHLKGNHIAQENMKERLKLAYADQANLKIERTTRQYRVSFSIPKE